MAVIYWLQRFFMSLLPRSLVEVKDWMGQSPKGSSEKDDQKVPFCLNAHLTLLHSVFRNMVPPIRSELHWLCKIFQAFTRFPTQRSPFFLFPVLLPIAFWAQFCEHGPISFPWLLSGSCLPIGLAPGPLILPTRSFRLVPLQPALPRQLSSPQYGKKTPPKQTMRSILCSALQNKHTNRTSGITVFMVSRRRLLSKGQKQDAGERGVWVCVIISQLAKQELRSTFCSLGSRSRSPKYRETGLPGLLHLWQREQEALIPLSASFCCWGNSLDLCSVSLSSSPVVAAALEAPRHSQQSLDGCFGDNLGSI